MSGDPVDLGTRKRIATAQARAALIGATLLESPADNGGPELILTKWALTRAYRISEIDQIEATLDSMGAPR